MFNFIICVIILIIFAMCIRLFKRLNELESKINLIDPALDKPKTKSTTDIAPMPTTPPVQKTPPKTVSKPITETAKPVAGQTKPKPKPTLTQAATQASPTVTSKPDSFVLPEIPAKKPAAVNIPKQFTPEPDKHIPPGDSPAVSPFAEPELEDTPPQASMEQVIGTRWIPIAGILVLICGAAFFIKYAYDNYVISDITKILIVASAGFVSLIIGEITRRRKYEIVAKSVTALGFALLYISVFAANAFYGILQIKPALTIAIAITAAAMLYAVILDEIVIAFLSLLGGYLTPIIITAYQDMPVPLFAYLLVLSIGAIQCAYYRKWRPVNLLAFVGTFALYASWYFRNYQRSAVPRQMTIALTALAAFFLVFLVLPILYNLIKKTKAGKEDVLLVLVNSAVTWYFLYAIVDPVSRMALAFATLALSAVHLAVTAVAKIRSKEDSDLHAALLAISMVALTVSLPLFFKAGTLSFAWAAQSAALAFIGIRYRSLMVRLFGLAALALSCINLFWCLPMHNDYFRLIFNPSFGVWLSVAAAAYVNHLIYRHTSESEEDLYSWISQLLYVLMGALLIAASIMEWYYHCFYNLSNTFEYMIVKALPVIFAAVLTIFVVRPLCPAGKTRETFAILIGVAGTICTVISLAWLHNSTFTFIANKEFFLTALFPASLALCYILNRLSPTETLEIADYTSAVITQITYALMTVILIALCIAEWFFHCDYNLKDTSLYMIFKAVPPILAAAVLMCYVRPLCPAGIIREKFAWLVSAAGIITTVISLVWLHNRSFTIIANSQFLSVMTFPAVLAVCHVLYRFVYTDISEFEENITRQFYGLTGLLLMLSATAEWFYRCYLGQAEMLPTVIIGQTLIFAVSIPFFIARPLSPMGKTTRSIAVCLTLLASVFTSVASLFFYHTAFTIFLNFPFIVAMLFAASLAASSKLLYMTDSTGKNYPDLGAFFGLTFVAVLWLLLNEQIFMFWYCRNLYHIRMENWIYKAHMCISIMWALYAAALMIAGFWKRVPTLRYVALGLFGLLLAKVFIIDTSQVENIFRITAFIATGIVLVSIAYLYQFLKKRNFFENLTATAIITEEE